MRWAVVLLVGCGRVALEAPDTSDATPDACTVGVADMHPPLREPACSAEQIAQLQSCAWPCPTYDYEDAGYACMKCIEGSNMNSAQWGAIVQVSFDPEGVLATANTFGCVDLLSGTTCGDALWQRFECVGHACDYGAAPPPHCPVFDSGTCEEAALAGPCKPYVDAIATRCAGLVDANDTPVSSSVAACFPDPNITDPNAQRIALWKTLAKIFCGP